MTAGQLIFPVISNCETEEKTNFPIFHWIAPDGSSVYAAKQNVNQQATATLFKYLFLLFPLGFKNLS
jgi:hypothetical protein